MYFFYAPVKLSLAKIATRGKSSMGWVYGCKLHVVMNQLGEELFYFIQWTYC